MYHKIHPFEDYRSKFSVHSQSLQTSSQCDDRPFKGQGRQVVAVMPGAEVGRKCPSEGGLSICIQV